MEEHVSIYAKVIADTWHTVREARITTVEYSAPRYLLAEINTHGVLAKSAASSRAIPVAKRIEMATTAPYVPHQFGKNRPGMQASERVKGKARRQATDAWLRARNDVVKSARKLVTLDVHKQQANRLLEPFVYVQGVLTGTEWENFFALRDHADADPAFQELAVAIREAMAASEPRHAPFHLPYADTLSEDVELEVRKQVSAARCARISYRTFDGRVSSIEDDVALHDKLLASRHMSPFDHPAIADRVRDKLNLLAWECPKAHGRYWGWIPVRYQVEQRLGTSARRDSFGVF
jgi:thymidylate synthase ThyX